MRWFPAVLIAAALWGAALSPEASFEAGIKALAARDFTTALGDMEAALAADPDNLRYASEYRQAVIRANAYDRSLAFFGRLAAAAPNSGNLYLNYGFAYVDKIPAAGSITQVILANTALSYFSKAVELNPTWIAYYTRGNSYLYWPKIFGRAPLALADLKKAMAIQKSGPKRSYHVRVYISLGDAYWKSDDLQNARATWQEGLREYPGCAALRDRLARSGDELKEYLDDALDPSRRVDTNLQELWANP